LLVGRDVFYARIKTSIFTVRTIGLPLEAGSAIRFSKSAKTNGRSDLLRGLGHRQDDVVRRPDSS